MSDRQKGEHQNASLYNGSGHTEDYGSLRRCWTTDCGVRYTSSVHCRHCGEGTSTSLFRPPSCADS